MNLGLTNKRVIVLASSKGLGKATALQFAKEGAKILISSRNVEELKKAAEEIKSVSNNHEVYFEVCDVTKEDDINRLFQTANAKLGGVDILVNNAGGPTPGGFAQVTDEDWNAAFEKNLLSYIRTIRLALPYMKEQNFGRIVNISSSSTKEVLDGLILSNTFRLGMVGLSKSISREYAGNNILINTVGPGRIQTDRVTELDQMSAEMKNMSLDEIREGFKQIIPAGRYGEPEEFANIIVFLCSEANTYMTGQNIVVDGGMLKAL
ncbi:SDR family NAD(P)-dependent oxidoreductase [Psychrobacillus glaciei]|uniref:SDR family NAD(P)-dependent oxidoreductase n=1 Tax=Psychrobacillus glaciei TaxID=2283160 RepID=A0A5J6SJQ5_9BACI|nr:SDR family oxidoreductase [Psychrobacillus glaciei]QFF98206.1 SDR family NAD(P)-dependent oxidoreductase [Psychrobacillus glaciei]